MANPLLLKMACKSVGTSIEFLISQSALTADCRNSIGPGCRLLLKQPGNALLRIVALSLVPCLDNHTPLVVRHQRQLINRSIGVSYASGQKLAEVSRHPLSGSSIEQFTVVAKVSNQFVVVMLNCQSQIKAGVFFAGNAS